MAAYNDTLICMRLWLCDSQRLFAGFLAVLLVRLPLLPLLALRAYPVT